MGAIIRCALRLGRRASLSRLRVCCAAAKCIVHVRCALSLCAMSGNKGRATPSLSRGGSDGPELVGCVSCASCAVVKLRVTSYGTIFAEVYSDHTWTWRDDNVRRARLLHATTRVVRPPARSSAAHAGGGAASTPARAPAVANLLLACTSAPLARCGRDSQRGRSREHG